MLMLDTCFYISLSFFPPFPLPYFIDVLQWTGGLLLILCRLKNMRNSRRSKWSLIFWIWFLGIQGKHSFFSSVAPAWWGWRAGRGCWSWFSVCSFHHADDYMLQDISWFIQDCFWSPGISNCLSWSFWHAYDAGIKPYLFIILYIKVLQYVFFLSNTFSYLVNILLKFENSYLS